MTIVEIILLALSLSVDSFVVSMCGSVTLGKIKAWKVSAVAFAFAAMQAMLLFVGWVFGGSIVNYISSISNIVGFALLLYIGANMIVPALKKGGEKRSVDLAGFRNILLAAVATSVDASAVGVSLAMTEMFQKDFFITLITVFVVTFVFSAIGIAGGSSIGNKFGKPAQITGGAVLILIGLRLLLG